jgi:PAS domain S-box-containing protein
MRQFSYIEGVISPLDSDYLSLVLDTISQGIFTISEDWTITTFNRAAERISGYRSDEAVGRKCFEVFRAGLCEGDCPLRRAMGLRETVRDVRTSILRRDGSMVSIELSASALLDPDGGLIGGVESFQDLTPIDELRKQLDGRYRFDDIIAKSRSMQRVIRMLQPVAESDSQVLVTGPSGSGKELVARAIHNHSRRADGPFVAVNCAALPDTLLESELFGYMRGAFTGATRDKPGRIAQAQGGTLFLDEVAELKPSLQVKMLRFLQDRTYEPLGSNASLKADVRVIAATNRVLECMVAEGTFREDLFYRLNVVQVPLPPLAERREDIALLVHSFVERFRHTTGKPVQSVAPDAMEALCDYTYPGNVRELENLVERAFVFTHGRSIELDSLPEHVRSPGTARAPGPAPGAGRLADAEVVAIRAALERHAGNRSRAARELGIHRSTLLRKIRALGLG